MRKVSYPVLSIQSACAPLGAAELPKLSRLQSRTLSGRALLLVFLLLLLHVPQRQCTSIGSKTNSRHSFPAQPLPKVVVTAAASESTWPISASYTTQPRKKQKSVLKHDLKIENHVQPRPAPSTDRRGGLHHLAEAQCPQYWGQYPFATRRGHLPFQ